MKQAILTKERFNIQSVVDDYINNGNHEKLISIGQNLVNVNREISIEDYIMIICNSKNPEVAAIIVHKMHHEGVELLEKIILDCMNDGEWSLYAKIITLIYLDKKDSLIEVFDELHKRSGYVIGNFKRAIFYFTNQSEYNYVFELINLVSKSKSSIIIKDALYNYKINNFYVGKYANSIKETAKELYIKNQYSELFKLCKNFNILNDLKQILEVSPDKLILKFLDSESIDGIRLAYRVIKSQVNSTEEAYKKILTKINNMNQSDEVQYMTFIYIMKLIKLERQISNEYAQKICDLGTVKLLFRENHGKKTLIKALECILLEKGLEEYNDFIRLLDNNNIFRYKNCSVIYNYKEEQEEEIEKRKSFIFQLKQRGWTNIKIIEFYMRSFLRYTLSLGEFLEVLYGKHVDRVLLYNIFKRYRLKGKIVSVNYKDKYALALTTSFSLKEPLTINNIVMEEGKIRLLKEGDKFLFKISKYIPIKVRKFNIKSKVTNIDRIDNGSILINFDTILGEERKEEFNNFQYTEWEKLKAILLEIIDTRMLKENHIESLKKIERIDLKKLDIISKNSALFVQAINSLSDDANNVSKFIKSLHKNNIFGLKFNMRFNQINIERELFLKTKDAFNSLIEQDIPKKQLIDIFVNSHFRFLINFQCLLKQLYNEGDKVVDLLTLFYGYKFTGNLLPNLNNRKWGKNCIDVISKNIKYNEKVKFYIDQEYGISNEAINKNVNVYFRLNKYDVDKSTIFIKEVMPSDERYKRTPSAWQQMHNHNNLIKYKGKINKGLLKKISELGKLSNDKADYNKLIEAYVWNLNNLCNNKSDLSLYLEALNENNPFKYGLKVESYINEYEALNSINSLNILNKLIRNEYEFYEIINIYLNSVLNKTIDLDECIKIYYDNKNRKQDIYNFPKSVIEKIELTAIVCEINGNDVYLSFRDLKCKCNVFLDYEYAGTKVNNFNISDELKVCLISYNKLEDCIVVQ